MFGREVSQRIRLTNSSSEEKEKEEEEEEDKCISIHKATALRFEVGL